ncbi:MULTISPECIES: permease prefix domain 1-containing protein [unclassified Nocardiopsis]|uniref:permease prefix domain 1-containing protein n=1 Tax=unclassified Nocardiopsis TaxID=2649073 RepID=UPI00340F7363
MNVVTSYLDTMFSAYPQTSRLLEARAELQGMMEDAYATLIAEGHTENEAVGRVIRDFGSLEEVAPVLGITTDLASAPTATSASAAADAGAGAAPALFRHPPVTLAEAQDYAEARRRTRFHTSAAVVLFVLSPAALITLPVATASGVLTVGNSVGIFVGIVILLVLVAIGVTLLITASRETAPHRRIAEDRFSVNPEVTRWAEALARRNSRGRTRSLRVAIALWILGPLPLVAAALFTDSSPQGDSWTMVGVVVVLAIVAAGLGVLLPQTWAHTAAGQLTRGSGAERSAVGVIAVFYWPLLAAIYLAWSLVGEAWGDSWVVWPIGAVLFAGIAAGSHATERYRRAR